MDGRDDQGPLAFCVVANVTQWTAHGEGGLELQRGLRHFPPGAKVWVLPVMWGDGGANVIVVGHHRGTRGRGYTRMVIARRHLADFRVQGIYSPALLEAIAAPWRDLELRLWGSRAEAEEQADYWRDHPVEAHADDWSFDTCVSDPPPLDLQHQGRTYYLAQFNARRAVYSADVPLREPPLFADCEGAELLQAAGIEVVEVAELGPAVEEVNASVLLRQGQTGD